MTGLNLDVDASTQPATDRCVGARYAEAGVIFIDKPQGPTSANIVARVKRALRDAAVIQKTTKLGHGGTLDPMATGLLVVLLGRATKLADYALHADKAYSGTILLGQATDTDDVTGSPIGIARAVPVLNQEQLDALAKQFTGRLSQQPPAFSALKVAGQRAYDLARAGKDFELASRDVTISRCLLALDNAATLRFEIESSGGTYIRALARDFGAALGCGATLASLRRERSGRFLVSCTSEWQEDGLGLPVGLKIAPWWDLLPHVQRFAVEAPVSAALSGGEQRVLQHFVRQIGSTAQGQLLIYSVGEVPHGVVRCTDNGLELVLHIGEPISITAQRASEPGA